jgi:hypothetical protein
MKNINDISVERLLLQYREYKEISKNIIDLENSYLLEKNSDVLSRIDELKTRLARLSDEMSFANHIVWMKYKREAYRNQSGEIASFRDFKKHCSPVGYICTKRFQFLATFLSEELGVDVLNSNNFKDSMDLLEFMERSEVQGLLENKKFMEGWQKNEYYISDGKINKWGNFKIE